MRFSKIFLLFIFAGCISPSVFGQTKISVAGLSRCWIYPTGKDLARNLASDGTRVFLGLSGAKVEALSLDGKKVWSSELGGDITSNILTLESGILLVTSTIADGDKPGSSMIRSLSKETGITNWILKLPNAKKHFLKNYDDAVAVVSISGVIQSIDAKSGSVKWKREIANGFDAEPAYTLDKILVAATGKQIFGIFSGTGEIDSIQKVPFSVTALAITPTGDTIVGDNRGNIVSINGTTTKPRWKFKSGGAISALSVIGEYVLASSNDNFVYYIQSRNGNVEWKKRLSGRVSYIANILDLYALSSGVDENGAVLTDLSNARVAGQIVLGEEENLVSTPVVSNGNIFILTNEAAYSYGLNLCAPNHMSGPLALSIRRIFLPVVHGPLKSQRSLNLERG